MVQVGYQEHRHVWYHRKVLRYPNLKLQVFLADSGSPLGPAYAVSGFLFSEDPVESYTGLSPKAWTCTCDLCLESPLDSGASVLVRFDPRWGWVTKTVSGIMGGGARSELSLLLKTATSLLSAEGLGARRS